MKQKPSTLDTATEFGRDPIEVAPDLWWVGSRIEGDPFQSHAYLLDRGDQSVLFDLGSTLTWPETRRKIDQLMSFDDIRWFVAHHQDPDVCGALPEVDALITREDARIVTHWRVSTLLKHYDPRTPFWLIDEHEWQLDIGDRRLQFIFTPYLHFPGAFVTFDRSTGTLLSSDLFGGFSSDDKVFTAGLADFEGVRAFHEHYMPHRDILTDAMVKLEQLPIATIAPQHGKLIIGDDVKTFINGLKELDCGLYLMAQTDTHIGRLQGLNRLLHKTVETIAGERDLPVVLGRIFEGIREVMPLESADIVCRRGDDRALWMSSADGFRGSDVDLPTMMHGIAVGSDGWTDWIARATDCGGFPIEIHEDDLTVPLFSTEHAEFCGIVVLKLSEVFELRPELVDVLRRIAQPVSLAIERELLHRKFDYELEAMYERSIRDPLTDLFTRRYLDDAAAGLIELHDRNPHLGFSLMMLDIDHFKAVNDDHGHTVGDEVLVAVADVISGVCRRTDFAVRLGGEEFAILMPQTSSDDAAAMAERLRRLIEDLDPVTESGRVGVTVSVGVAGHCSGESLVGTIKKADAALYQAKQTGRNKICVDPAPS